MANGVFQNWPQQYFLPTSFSKSFHVPLGGEVSFPSLKTWIGLWTFWKNRMQVKYDLWVWLFICLPVSLSFNMGPSNPMPFYGEAQSRPQEETTWKRADEEEVEPTWQPTLAITHRRKPTFTWFQQPGFKSSARTPGIKEQRKTISVALSLKCLTHRIHEQNKSMFSASKWWVIYYAP